MTPQEAVIQKAISQLGYLEKASNKDLDDFSKNAGKSNFTKYARDLDKLSAFNTPKQGFDWCAVFVVWCFQQCLGLENALKMLYLNKGGDGAGCTQAMKHYKYNDAFYKQPQAGDQIFFSNGQNIVHTGIVERVLNGYVYTIEGNTSSNSGVIANGGAVARKKYILSYGRIAGYGRPNWSIAKNHNLGGQDMTGQEIFKKLNDYLSALPLPTWAESEYKAAVDAGITDGSNPMSLIPRYQAAIMAYRAAYGKEGK